MSYLKPISVLDLQLEPTLSAFASFADPRVPTLNLKNQTMPSQLPTSFASAAATNGVGEGPASGRINTRAEGSGDW